MELPENKFLSWSEVLDKVGLSHYTVRKLIRDGYFPRGRVIAGRTVRWGSVDIELWMRAQPLAGRGPLPFRARLQPAKRLGRPPKVAPDEVPLLAQKEEGVDPLKYMSIEELEKLKQKLTELQETESEPQEETPAKDQAH